MSINLMTGGGTYRLQSSIGTTDSTIKLSSFLEPVSGTPYTMALINTTIAYGTLDPQTPDRSEFISFTGIIQNADGTATLTGVTRGLARSSPFTSDPVFKQTHSGQSIFVMSNSPQIYNDIYTYVDNLSIAGSVPATTTVEGIAKLSTAPVDANHPIVVGNNDTRVPTQDEKDALAGTSGAPSAANKYVTAAGLPTVPSVVDIQNFETSGTWTKPTGAKTVQVICIGGGGGGAHGAAATGGGGGGGGGISRQIFPASLLGATETVTVGTGGTNAPSTGNPTTFGAWMNAGGGIAGVDGAGGGAGGGGGAGMSLGGAIGAIGLTGGSGGGNSNTQGGNAYFAGAAGGGGGGQVGGVGAIGGSQVGRATIIDGGLAGASSGGAGGAATDCTQYEPIGGAGGGSGGGGSTGGVGGKGGKYGGGGGGGGAATVTPGTGGVGANGFCQVITYF